MDRGAWEAWEEVLLSLDTYASVGTAARAANGNTALSNAEKSLLWNYVWPLLNRINDNGGVRRQNNFQVHQIKSVVAAGLSGVLPLAVTDWFVGLILSIPINPDNVNLFHSKTEIVAAICSQHIPEAGVLVPGVWVDAGYHNWRLGGLRDITLTEIGLWHQRYIANYNFNDFDHFNVNPVRVAVADSDEDSEEEEELVAPPFDPAGVLAIISDQNNPNVARAEAAAAEAAVIALAETEAADALAWNTMQFDMDIPVDFLDPITGALMKDPVILPSGQSVDDDTIAKWIRSRQRDGLNPTDMFTGEHLRTDVRPNLTLRNAILSWVDTHRVDPAAAEVADISEMVAHLSMDLNIVAEVEGPLDAADDAQIAAGMNAWIAAGMNHGVAAAATSIQSAFRAMMARRTILGSQDGP